MMTDLWNVRSKYEIDRFNRCFYFLSFVKNEKVSGDFIHYKNLCSNKHF